MNSKNKIKQLFLEIKDALRGEEHDYTQGNLKRAVFLLSVPMVLEMLMESIFAIVDIFFVSKLGADAIATVGLTESIITIIYAISSGLSVATSAIVSRRIGEKKYEKASKSSYQAIITGIIISIIIAVPGILFSKDMLRLMNASDNIVNEMSSYTTIMFGSNLVILMLFINNAIFRSSGNPVIALKVLLFANGINIILDPIFIFGLGPIPAMGVQGAAVATTIGRGMAVLLQFYYLLRGKSKINLLGINLNPDFKMIGRILNLSIGTVSQHIISQSSWIILMSIVAVFGSEVLAGYTIALRIIMFVLLPGLGISNAASTLVGQNLGAGLATRAEKSAIIASGTIMILMGIISVFLIAWPESFISLLSADKNIISYGGNSLRIVSIGLILYGLGMVLVNTINGAGDTRTPFYVNIVAFWLIEIPLAWFLSKILKMEQNGVFLAIVFAESVMTLSIYYFFKKGKWKLKEV
ncbi:MAG: MATE family efflux transporter [Prolixibacteraceae bacterium]|nr:MATE family efflux transporter [Prolixibacteraceae bacterium]